MQYDYPIINKLHLMCLLVHYNMLRLLIFLISYMNILRVNFPIKVKIYIAIAEFMYIQYNNVYTNIFIL